MAMEKFMGFIEKLTGSGSASKPDQATIPTTTGPGMTDDERARVIRLKNILKDYQDAWADRDAKIIENDRWYKSLHWEIYRSQNNRQKSDAEPEPVTALLWNTIANGHGDLMDAYPEPVFMEREPSDKDEADSLSKVVKVILDRNNFRKTYSDNAWTKTKSVAAAYHMGWDKTMEGGLGDIMIRKTDVLRMYWKPGIDNLQDTPHLFVLSMVPTATLRKQYTALVDEGNLNGGTVEMKRYYDESKALDTEETLVIDHYEKEIGDDGVTVVHLDKIIGPIIVDSTRYKTWNNDEAEKIEDPNTTASLGDAAQDNGSMFAEGAGSTSRPDTEPEAAAAMSIVKKPMVKRAGLYNHGKYPFAIDVLFPEEHSVVGLSMVDILKSQQIYIDKLDQIITKNALVSGRQRVIYREDGGIDPKDLADLTKDFIPTKGKVTEGEDFAILQAKPLAAYIIQHRQNKISELKEVSGMNDFNRGSAASGVTAASAIMALQEAGNKLARAKIANTYDCYTEICNQVLELIAQFYDEPRKFRITNKQGEPEYVDYSNAGLQPEIIPSGAMGVAPTERKPIFDIVVHAEKSSPYAALARNQLAKELFSAGFFTPEQAPAALTALKFMDFEGKDSLYSAINDMYQEQVAIQTGMQQAQQELAQNQQIVMQMNEFIKRLTGKDMLAGANIGQEQGAIDQQGGMMQ